jgi:Tfp pilus assembly protein PilF
LRLLALVAMNAEHYGQAEELLKRAVEVAPDFLDAWIDLSRAHLERFDFQAALASIEHALRLNPRSASVLVNLANVQARSGRHDAAITTYRRAIEQNPNMLASHVGLGNTLKTVGQQAEAIDAYRRATVLRPEVSEAWWSLSNLKTFRFTDEEVETMQQQLERADLVRRGARAVLFSRWPRRVKIATTTRPRSSSTSVATVCGARSRATTRPRPKRSYERIAAVFDAGFLAQHAGRGHPDPAPIFVVGLPRSGSTRSSRSYRATRWRRDARAARGRPSSSTGST